MKQFSIKRRPSRRLNNIILLSIIAITAISAPISRVLAESVIGYDWTTSNLQTTTHRNWIDTASSADGTKLITADYGGYLYTSTDSGATWVERTDAGVFNWRSVASSDDGTKLVAAVANCYI